MTRPRFKLTSRAAQLSVGEAAGRLSQLVVALIAVRLLEPAAWTDAALVLSIYLAAVTFGTLNLHQGVYFYIPRLARGEQRWFAAQTFGLLAGTGAIAAAIVLGLHTLLTGGPYTLGGSLVAVALAIVLEVPSAATTPLLVSAERPGRAALFTGVFAALRSTVVIAAFAAGAGIEGACVALVGYAAARLVVGAVMVRSALPPATNRPASGLVIEHVRYTLPLALALGTGVLNVNVDKWLVAALDPIHFGTYALAAHEIPLVTVLPFAVGAALATRMATAFANGDRGRAHEYWLAATARGAAVVVPLAIAAIVCAPALVAVLFTDDHLLAVLPFQLYSVIVLHRVAEYGFVLRAAGDTRSLWWASAVLLATNLALSVPLTSAFGMVGAAIGTLAANVVAWLFILTRIAGALGVRFDRVLPWRLYGAAVLASAAAAAVAFGVAGAVGAPPAVELPLQLATFATIYLAAAGALRLRRRLPPVPRDSEAFA